MCDASATDRDVRVPVTRRRCEVPVLGRPQASPVAMRQIELSTREALERPGPRSRMRDSALTLDAGRGGRWPLPLLRAGAISTSSRVHLLRNKDRLR